MSRYAHALHATLSSRLIRSRLSPCIPLWPFLASLSFSLSLSAHLVPALLLPFLILVPSHFPSFLIHRLHTLFSFFRSPPYPSPLRDVHSILSHLREVTQDSPSPHFPLGRRLLHSFLTRQTRRPIFPSGLLLSYTFDVLLLSTVRKMLDTTESNCIYFFYLNFALHFSFS